MGRTIVFETDQRFQALPLALHQGTIGLFRFQLFKNLLCSGFMTGLSNALVGVISFGEGNCTFHGVLDKQEYLNEK